MSLDDEDSSWLLALEAALQDSNNTESLLQITQGCVLPDEHRAQVWYQCLGGGEKSSNFSKFDEVFDLPEQTNIRTDCQTVVAALGNAEEDKVSVVSDVESIISHYCKTKHLQYQTERQWIDLLIPLLATKLTPDRLYKCFEEILDKYVLRETCPNAPVYHLLRLLLQYHDPQLSNYIDSLKITPDQFAGSWVKSLFASVCPLDAVIALWDIYFQERDPFFILFLSIVILINARDQILSEKDKKAVLASIKELPGALSPDDAPEFCSLARYYALRTPRTFRKEFFSALFVAAETESSDNADTVQAQVTGALPLQQALCLPVSAEELLSATSLTQLNGASNPQVGFFIIDCRPAEQYNSGHLPNAFHLDSMLMLEAVSSFQTALQGLFIAQRGAIEAHTPGCGPHLCLLGGGELNDEEDQLLHMVAASMLQQHTAYVSLVKGGYTAIHSLLEPNVEKEFSDHVSSKCRVCRAAGQTGSLAAVGLDSTASSSAVDAPTVNGQHATESSLFNKFSSISSVFKTKSAEMKEKLVEYITNPTGMEEGAAGLPRHASPDDTGDLYRGARDIFTIGEDDSSKSSSGVVERVNLQELLRRPSIVTAFSCHQVKENGYMHESQLLLTERGVLVVRLIEGNSKQGDIVARRSLVSIMKITSKKKHPDLITFKYGFTKNDGEVIITDMDRFLIPNASRATHAVKELILKRNEENDSTIDSVV